MDRSGVISSLFGVPRALIGVVHTRGLPGTPSASEPIERIVEAAVAEARVYASAGFHGVERSTHRKLARSPARSTTPHESIDSLGTDCDGRATFGARSVNRYRTAIARTSSVNECAPLVAGDGTTVDVRAELLILPATFASPLSPAAVHRWVRLPPIPDDVVFKTQLAATLTSPVTEVALKARVPSFATDPLVLGKLTPPSANEPETLRPVCVNEKV
jgi:BtpA family